MRTLLTLISLTILPALAAPTKPVAPYRDPRVVSEEITAFAKDSRLHPQLIERLRLVPTDDADVKILQAEGDRVLRRLYPKMKLPPIQFHISDEPGVNAFAIKHATNPAHVGLTRDALTKLDNEDQFAALVAHETRHILIARLVGAGRNSKGEETLVESQSITDLANAGYDAEQVRTMHLNVFAKERGDGWLRDLHAIMDVHVSDAARVRAVELTSTALHRERGNLARPITPMPEALRRVGAHPARPIHPDVQLTAWGWSDASTPAQKLNLITRYLREADLNDVRLAAVKEKIHALYRADRSRYDEFKMPEDPEAVRAIDEFATVAFHLPERAFGEAHALDRLRHTSRQFFGSLFGEQYSWRHGDESISSGSLWPVTGPFRPLAAMITDFMAADNMVAATRLANNINHEVRRLTDGFKSTALIDSFDWPRFPLDPNIEDVADLPWSHLVQFAVDDTTGQVHQAMLTLGISDPRLSTARPEGSLTFKMSSMPRISRPPFVEDPNAYQVTSLEQMHLVHGNIEYRFDARPREFNAGYIKGLLRRLKQGDETARPMLVAFTKSRILRSNDRAGVFDPDLYALDFDLMMGVNAVLDDGDYYRKLPVIFDQLLARDRAKFAPLIRRFYLEAFADPQRWVDPNRWQYESSYFSSPVVLFLPVDKHHLFSDDEKLKALEVMVPAANYVDEILFASGIPSQGRLFHYNGVLEPEASLKTVEVLRHLLHYQAPQTWDELYAVMDKLKRSPVRFAGWFALHEAFAFIMKHQGRGLEIDRMLARLPRFADLPKSNHHDTKYTAILKAILTFIPLDLFIEGSLAERIHRFKAASELTLLPQSLEDRAKIGRAILAIARTETPATVLPLIEILLIDARVDNYELRQEVIQLWTQSMVDVFGRDDGTEAYGERIGEIVRRVTMKTNLTDRRNMLRGLGAAVQAQAPLAELLRENASAYTRAQLSRSQMAGVMGELLIHIVEREPELGQRVAHYLVKPLTDASVNRLIDHITRTREYKTAVEFGMDVKPAQQRDQLREFYRAFWAGSLESRTAIADLILMPPSRHSTLTFDDAFNFVLDELLPPHPIYHHHVKTLLRGYLDTLKDYQRGVYLAAVMAASHQTTENEPMNPGKFISAVGAEMGPFEKKFVQAIHSYPGTPEDIRTGIAHTKVMLDVPAVWDMWDQVHELPAEIQAQIKRVNGFEGAASLYQVLSVTLHADSKLARKNGSTKAALALLRPYSDARTADGFSRGQRFAESIADPTLHAAVAPILVEAKKLTELEIDPDHVARSFAIAADLYGGVEITLEGKVHHVTAARLLAHGPTYKIMSLAEGRHLNEIKDPAELRRWSIVHLFTELALLVQGRPTDADPHGGNVRIDDSTQTLTRIDLGGIAPHAPTASELNLLGELIYGLITNTSSRDVATRFVGEISRMQHQHPSEAPYLARVQAAFIALQDAWRNLSEADTKLIFTALLKSETVHPEVRRGLRGTTMVRKIKVDLVGASARAAPCDLILTRIH